MSSSYIAGYFFKDDSVLTVLRQASELVDRVVGVYVPAGWFASAVTKCDVPSALLLVGVSSLLFVAVFFVVGGSYRQINSALMSHAAKRGYKMSAQRQRSVLNALAFKEFKRLTGSSTYMVNGAMGEVLAVLMGIAVLVVGFDNVVGMVMYDAPIDPAILQPAIPFVVYFFIGMVATTVCSPSLEGKNYWIVQSLPLDKRTVYRGKMLFNLYLTVPFMTFAVVCLCVSAQVPVIDAVAYVGLGIALCAFSTAWGCVCGIRHMRLDWENEVEVIKQGTAVAVYLFPNMFVTMGLVAAVVFLGMQVNHALLASAFALVAAALAVLSYRRAMTLADRT
jgi:ABC-2 type transport system permease protein